MNGLISRTIRHSAKTVFTGILSKGVLNFRRYIVTDDDLWFAHRMVNEAMNECTRQVKGPVHINVPLTEPLYDEIPPPSENIRDYSPVSMLKISVKLPEELIDEWKKAKRIMIIHGQDVPGNDMTPALKPLSERPEDYCIG